MKRKNHEFARLAGCQGKVRFDTWREARHAAIKPRQKKRTRRRREPYHCRYCDGFHIGTPDRKDRDKEK